MADYYINVRMHSAAFHTYNARRLCEVMIW